MIRIKRLSRTNLSEDYAHSLLISLLRGLAALEVAAAHLRAETYPGYALVARPGAAFQCLAFVTGFAHQAVVVFFLLSGWLVGGSLFNKRTRAGAFGEYVIDRVTRLWIVLVPVFVLILGIGILTARIDPRTFSVATDNEYSATTFVGNLVGLQKMAVPTFGGNFPLWSLSNETWYYVLFPLLVIAAETRSMFNRATASVACAGLAWLLDGPLMLYFTLWLLGAAGSRFELQARAAVRWILLLAFASASILFRMKGKNLDLGYDAFPQDLLFGVLFILFLTSMQVRLVHNGRLLATTKRVAGFFADFSFTLYAIHIPLIGVAGFFFSDLARNRLIPNSPAHLLAYAGTLAAIVATAYIFHLPFEANTRRLRTTLKSVALRARSPA